MTTTNDMMDRYEDAERGLEWLEKLEALQARSASNRAAFEVAEYVMKLRSAVTALAGDRTAAELSSIEGSLAASSRSSSRRAPSSTNRGFRGAEPCAAIIVPGERLSPGGARH